MSKSNRLRISDIEACFDVVEQTRERWADPTEWREHLLQGICRLTGQAVGHYVEVDPTSLGGGPVRFLAMADCGWRDNAARSHFVRYSQDMTGKGSIRFPGMEKIFAELMCTGRVVMSRRETCSDAEWYSSALLNEFRRPAFNDGHIMSFMCSPVTGRCSQLGVHQDIADRAPSLHAKRLLELVHRRIAPLIDSTLASDHHRSRQGLTPRLQQTLDRLLAGDSLKEIAGELCISLATAHEYVGKVYRHFNVNSHPDLMAYFLRRRPNIR